jgi:DNA-binding LacI/PurR family transcriptional regulator
MRRSEKRGRLRRYVPEERLGIQDKFQSRPVRITGVLIAYTVNRATIHGEPIYHFQTIQAHQADVCQGQRSGHDTLTSDATGAMKFAMSKRVPHTDSGHRVTLKKLAEHLGLSRTTISMILNDVPEATRFPEETRQRVVESAKKFGYRPNYFARSLGSRRTNLIGVVAPDFGNGFEAAVLSGFERRLLNTGYTSLVATHLWSAELLQRHIETLCDRGVEGLLLINSTPSESPGIPAVTICADRSPIWSTRISIDNAFGIRKAINHLASLGHREIAFIKGPEESGDTQERWNAVLSTCKAIGIRVDPRLTIQLKRLEPGTHQTEEGRIAAEDLLRRGKRFTALVAFNDTSALGAMTALREAGRKVPEDVSLIGFDDIEFASLAFPALTTIRQPMHEMGATAAELLLRKLANDESVQNIRIRPELIVRSSTCQLSSASAKGKRQASRSPR